MRQHEHKFPEIIKSVCLVIPRCYKAGKLRERLPNNTSLHKQKRIYQKQPSNNVFLAARCRSVRTLCSPKIRHDIHMAEL